MKKVFKKLTDAQIGRGVIFTSTLSEKQTEQDEDKTHEVLKTDEAKHAMIERLRNDKFFDGSHWQFNIIRQ